MTHWLDEAESRSSSKKSRGRSAGFLDRKMRVKKNLDKNKEQYDQFIDKLKKLIDRANQLPLEQKEPYGHIDVKFKDTKLGNKMYVFRSSRRYQRQLPKKIVKRLLELSVFKLFRPSHFKHIRVIYLTLSSKIDQVGFELKEEVQLKQRVVVDKEIAKDKVKYYDKNRIHDYFNSEISGLNEDLALQILDYLAFKIDARGLGFVGK